ncbi:leucine zipper protein, putative [Trichomonas vaginalis G3]|uniref:Leucine zipper protein, putative n=1 Tax=Trichomonas vaginalis (strain ATCC PRA-98 / G3) TaxID=412133 RepID=A2D9T8_TRIV3|nr:beta-catenin binding [Trichomonas vaginalis G3]EAY22944.1 leucine zipper protein, putative [Trichomonas vaginalis G3]KAI5527304.1 beta-catenin binding [Trichomonas vaginalis G3]|eukprot:XP_001583930.1 leucine zipper protein [Trichomonas vaginalis G3]
MSKVGAPTDETQRLKEMVESQLHRLLCQLKDLDELKDQLTEEEITETKAETMDELREFRDSLDRMLAGDMTLMTELSAMRLAIRAAINEAFKTPEVIRMFSSRRTDELKNSLEKLKEAWHLKSITKQMYEEKAVEILTALQSLGESLSNEDAAFLKTQMSAKFSEFEESSNSVNQAQQKSLIDKFGSEAKTAGSK